MGGRYVRRVWEHDPTTYAPARYRRACSYEAFIPDPITGVTIELSGDILGVLSEAEKAIADLNAMFVKSFR